MYAQSKVDLIRPDKKPNIILEYNAIKDGSDTADQMLRMYSTKRMTRRWPMAIFYNMLDTSAQNAFVVWMSLNREREWENNDAFFGNREAACSVSYHSNFLGFKSLEVNHGPSVREPPKKRARCYCCAREKDRKSGIVCASCGLAKITQQLSATNVTEDLLNLIVVSKLKKTLRKNIHN